MHAFINKRGTALFGIIAALSFTYFLGSLERTNTLSGQASNVVQIIDNGDPGYSANIAWWMLNWQNVTYENDIDIAQNGTDRSSTWSFTSLPNGEYEVHTTWFGHTIFASSAPYVVTAGSDSQTVIVNQQNAPADAVIDGTAWKSLGTFTVTDGTLAVGISASDATGGWYTSADAVRVAQTSGGGDGNDPQPSISLQTSGANPPSVLPGQSVTVPFLLLYDGPQAELQLEVERPQFFILNTQDSSQYCNQPYPNSVIRCNGMPSGEYVNLVFDVPTDIPCPILLSQTSISAVATAITPGAPSPSTPPVEHYAPDVVCGAADLSLNSPTISPDSVQPGQSITVPYIVTNAGPNHATNVRFESQIPAGFVFNSQESADFCQQEGDLIVCQGERHPNISDWYINFPEQSYFNLVFDAPSTISCPQTLEFNAGVGSRGSALMATNPQADPIQANNTRSSTVQVACAQADISVTEATFEPDTVRRNGETRGRWTVSNSGPGGATDVAFTIPELVGLVFDETKPNDQRCRLETIQGPPVYGIPVTSRAVVCTIEILAPNASTQIDLYFTLTNISLEPSGLSQDPHTVGVIAEVLGGAHDPDHTNNRRISPIGGAYHLEQSIFYNPNIGGPPPPPPPPSPGGPGAPTPPPPSPGGPGAPTPSPPSPPSFSPPPTPPPPAGGGN